MLSWIRMAGLAGGAALAFGTTEARTKIVFDRMQPVAANEPIPLVDFFRSAQFEHPKLNRAGTHYAALVSLREDRQQLAVGDLAAGTMECKDLGDRDVTSFVWLTDRQILYRVNRDKIYSVGLYVADLDDPKDDAPVEARSSLEIIGVPERDPMRPIVWVRHNAYRDGTEGGVVQIDARRRARREGEDEPAGWRAIRRDDAAIHGTAATVVRAFPAPATGTPFAYVPDQNGTLGFVLTLDHGREVLHRWVAEAWQSCAVDLEAFEVIDFGDQPGELVVLGPRQSGKPRAVQCLDAVSGHPGAVLAQDDRYDGKVARIVRQVGTNRIRGIQVERDVLRSLWFDPAYAAMQATLDARFPGEIVAVLEGDRAENRFLVLVYSDRRPGEFYWFDREKQSLQLLRNAVPWIDPGRMRPVQMFRYRNRDGVELEAYLTLPAGASVEQPVPLVVLPHGGPWSREAWEWNPEAQFLASRGYAVFQPNYRGSTGNGWRFPVEDQWAFRKMHDDVTDGVRALRPNRLIDPDRRAIMGSSFGGFLALCGVAFEPDLYRCAVSIAGVSDWGQMILDARRQDDNAARAEFYERHLGSPTRDKATFDAISPLRHVAQIKVPVFVAHGREDDVVSVEQSQRLVTALRRNHAVYEAHFETGESHGLARIENLVELYAAIEAFLARNLAPGRAVAATVEPAH